MTTNNYRHLPIKDDAGAVVGLLDVAQLLQVCASATSFASACIHAHTVVRVCVHVTSGWQGSLSL